jgi:SAM-dependent methyltransferase
LPLRGSGFHAGQRLGAAGTQLRGVLLETGDDAPAAGLGAFAQFLIVGAARRSCRVLLRLGLGGGRNRGRGKDKTKEEAAEQEARLPVASQCISAIPTCPVMIDVGTLREEAVMAIEESVARHYTHGSLEQTILGALSASGKDIGHLHSSDLSGIDEFHLGSHAATVEFARNLGYSRGTRILDIGSGLGGPSRYFYEKHGCFITGVDLTEEFVAVADALTRRCGLSSGASFHCASGLDLPFANASFDGAYMIHVGMNIADKMGLFTEVRRVLRPGARFGVYDIMHIDGRPIPYPMPWAASEATSFVETPDTYRGRLAAAGFVVERECDRSALALEVGREMRESAARNGPPLLSLQAIMGAGTAGRFANVAVALQQGIIAPIEMIARAA